MRTASPSFLTPPEAAMVTGVSLRNINRVFDEPIVPRRFVKLRDGGRWLSFDGCAFVSFYFHTAARLTADERSRVMRAMAAQPRRSYGDEVLTVNFDRFVETVSARYADLRQAQAAVVEDADILGGMPVLRGTRIPVHDVAAAVRAGASVARLKAAYPGLDESMIEAARIYGEVHPRRGRPSSIATLHPDAQLVDRRRVVRKRRE